MATRVRRQHHPLTRAWLDFELVRVTIDVDRASFRAELLVRGPEVGGAQPGGFDGRWAAVAGLLLTAVVVPAGVSGGSA